MLGLPARDDVVARERVVRRLPAGAGHRRAGRTRPAAYREALAAAAALGVVGLVDFEFNAPREPWVERWHDGCDLLRVRWATYAAGLDEVIEAGLRTGDPLGTARRGRPADHGAAQDHQRRVAQHPDGVVLRPVRRRRRPRAPGRPAQPVGRRAARAARPGRRRRARGRDARDRRRGRGRRAAGLRRHRRDRVDRARPAGPARRRTPDGRARPAGQRPAGAPPRRPRPHREGLAGPRRAVLRLPLDARGRRRAGARLRRAGVTARPVAGDGRGRPPQRATTATRGTPSRRSRRRRRSPRRSTASPPWRPAPAATWCSSTANPLAAGETTADDGGRPARDAGRAHRRRRARGAPGR